MHRLASVSRCSHSSMMSSASDDSDDSSLSQSSSLSQRQRKSRLQKPRQSQRVPLLNMRATKLVSILFFLLVKCSVLQLNSELLPEPKGVELASSNKLAQMAAAVYASASGHLQPRDLTSTLNGQSELEANSFEQRTSTGHKLKSPPDKQEGAAASVVKANAYINNNDDDDNQASEVNSRKAREAAPVLAPAQQVAAGNDAPPTSASLSSTTTTIANSKEQKSSQRPQQKQQQQAKAAADTNDSTENQKKQQKPNFVAASSTPTQTSQSRKARESSQLIMNNNKISGHLRFEFQRYDGWYNNLANSDWGTTNQRLRRKVAPAYSDGVYQMADEGRPSARLLSQRMMRGDDGQSSRRNLTTIFAFFGQVISSEILMASESGCPIEMHRIKIEKCDPMYDRECRGGRTMPFLRATYDSTTGQSPNLPREQINKVTSWIDGSFIYSTSETWLNTMRSFNGKGTLKMVGSPYSSGDSSAYTANKNTEYNLDTLLVDPVAAGAALASQLTNSLTGNGNQKKEAKLAASSTQPEQISNNGAPMSLFGYPMRNQKRAPLINQMPAHHLKMKTAERMFLLGDPRTNQNPTLLAFGILFYRWHNVLAERIYAQHHDWSDEEIFQRARRLVIASLQNIFLYEYLPTLLDTPAPYSRGKNNGRQRAAAIAANQRAAIAGAGNNNQTDLTATNDGVDNLFDYPRTELEYDQNDLIRPYTGYKPDLHPGVSHVFQSAAFRFGHTMIPPGLYLRDDKCNFLNTPSGFKGIRLCSTWWNAEEVISKVGIEQILMGAASQIAEREDYVLCNDVRDKLFGPLDFSRRDLAALNIMRGRDNGLADYNTVRQAFKLPKITQWKDINSALYAKQPGLFHELAELYDHQLDKIDLYIGGMLESDVERGRPGVLFRRIIKEQFERLRDSDRFWFENLESGIFSEAEIEEIRQIKLYDIIVNSTLIPDDSIQRNVFKFDPQDPCPQPGQLSSSQLQPCYIVKGHSYFKGNELTYALVCLTLIIIPIVCGLLAYGVVRYQDRKRRQFKTKQEYMRNIQASRSNGQSGASSAASSGKSSPTISQKANGKASSEAASKCEKFYAKEWLHSNLKRKIKVRFGPTPDETLYILDRKCQVQRKLNLSQSSTVVVELSSNYAYTLPVPLQSSVSASSSKANSTTSLVTSASASETVVRSEPFESDQQQSRRGDSESSLTSALDKLTAADLDQPVNHKPMTLIRVARNYDLVLQFYDVQQRRKFIFKLQAYLRSINKSMSLFRVPREVMLANAETKEKRQQRLEQFFREAYALTFGIGDGKDGRGADSSISSKVSPDIGMVMRTSLSRQEFAEALGMKSDSLFVKQMFNCVDKDGNGRISFQEFLDTVVMFSRGKPDDKLRIVFDMCDHSGKGVIEKMELVRMLRSLVDIAKTKSLTEDGVMQMIHEMFKAVGLQDKPMLTYDDFKLIINSHNQSAFSSTLNSESPGADHSGNTSSRSSSIGGDSQKFAPFNNMGQQILAIGLDMKGAKKNFLLDTTNRNHYHHHHDDEDIDSASQSSKETTEIENITNRYRKMTMVYTGVHQEELAAQLRAASAAETNRGAKGLTKAISHKWKAFITELEEHRQDIVYLLMFYVIVGVLFFERFIIYSFLSEHMDLRHVMGVGIAITRGSAASLSFCYALLLLSMCRNIMTWIRTMGVREYIPLDSHVKFHKIVAMTALVMTVLHTVGHCINFYHVTQQPVEHLRCLTKEMQFSGESRPTFFYWIFQTVTGSTGLILWILCSIIYVFAHQRVRQRAYSFFWSTHKLYYLIYSLTLLHGSSKLTGSPRFWIFFMIPAILFTIDKIMSLQTKLLQLEIFETECLPSDVISLKFARPPSFKFLSGQWVRVACTAFRSHEFHAFTLTSAPQDDYLSIHVRAQGPWTWKLRSMFDPANLQYNKLLNSQLPPRIRIEGPFGGGNQDWYKYEVAVMIGGGIGVTPYASILNDLVFGTSTNRYSGVSYKKVYFIWICPSHRNFEWFIDVLRDVENKDVTNVLEMHIFITQFFHKFDLRTTMLYICENHFQRVSNRSLFTGLKAINHFGRPDLAALLQHVQNQHSCVSKVGVFSCGPKAMTKSITEACEKINNRRKLPFFLHQYENFS